tara:strand:+ start:956 stop:1261 length:306 start_codon:yes stop_codon:yes gene_type:complete
MSSPNNKPSAPNAFENEIILMQLEWRREISDQIKDLKVLNNEMRQQLYEMREDFVKSNELLAVKNRIDSLENDRAKIVGGMFVLQVVGSALLWLIMKFWNN